MLPLASSSLERSLAGISLMEYRGKQIQIVQGSEPESWKWSVQLDETITKGGESKTRTAAMATAVMAIDKALNPKKLIVPPDQADVT